MANGRHTPKEILLGKKPNLNNLIFFGCKVFVHVYYEKKIDSKTCCIFVGYNEQSKGFWCYDPSTTKIVVNLNPIS
jgi:hypothetical protein